MVKTLAEIEVKEKPALGAQLNSLEQGAIETMNRLKIAFLAAEWVFVLVTGGKSLYRNAGIKPPSGSEALD